MQEETLARDPGHHRRRLALLRARARALLLGVGGVAAAWALLLGPRLAGAQPFDRPVQERPDLPGFAEEGPAELQAPAVSVLPAVPVPEPELRVRVRGYRIRGGTVFPQEELEESLVPWLGKEVGSLQLIDIRNTLTALYVDAGYVNSGAVIPDQDMADGFVEIVLVEGVLSRTEVSGAKYYRPQVLADRVSVQLGRPLRVRDIERALQLLQLDPRIERVHARLAPGERAGEAVLSLRVEEARPYRLSFEGSNYTQVTFGSYRGRFVLAHDNLLGFGDTLETRFRVSGGLFRFGGEYRLPVTSRGTVVSLRGEYSSSKVIENELADLDIETVYSSVRLGLEHPVYRSPSATLTLGVYGEWRRSETCINALRDILGCDAFSLIGSGASVGSGRTTVSMLRLSSDYVLRDANQVFAVRSLLSVGLPVLGASSSNNPDATFVAWLGQFQWARRFDFLSLQTIFRTDVQLVSDTVPTLERFTVGGHLTVRGYRENQLVRDQGVISSLELRVPLWARERPILELAPFADFGWSDFRKGSNPDPNILASVGVGLRWSITERIRANVYWGYQIQEVDTSGDLQDDGVQFSLTYDAF